MEFNYQKLFLALLPDLLVVVALFTALGVDYSRLHGSRLAKRYENTLAILMIYIVI